MALIFRLDPSTPQADRQEPLGEVQEDGFQEAAAEEYLLHPLHPHCRLGLLHPNTRSYGHGCRRAAAGDVDGAGILAAAPPAAADQAGGNDHDHDLRHSPTGREPLLRHLRGHADRVQPRLVHHAADRRRAEAVRGQQQHEVLQLPHDPGGQLPPADLELSRRRLRLLHPAAPRICQPDALLHAAHLMVDPLGAAPPQPDHRHDEPQLRDRLARRPQDLVLPVRGPGASA
mmetsp:Transcript_36304/g.113263  ORF Transcript_36304/g.113263 Transcript_36304/m.113263 type:complete len:230 (+) Transcript_36304:2257-2946(+)